MTGKGCIGLPMIVEIKELGLSVNKLLSSVLCVQSLRHAVRGWVG